MKKIIRLTEKDLTRLIGQTVMELDRSTYERASDVAYEKGYTKLSHRFREHGKEFGTNQEKYIIKMVVKYEDEEKVLNLNMTNIDVVGLGNSLRSRNQFNLPRTSNDEYVGEFWILYTEDLDSGVERSFEVMKKHKYSDHPVGFLMVGNYPSLPQTRKDAQKVLSFFESMGCNFLSGVDPRSISYDYSGL